MKAPIYILFMMLIGSFATPTLAGGGDGNSSPTTGAVSTTTSEINTINSVSQPLGGIIQVNNGYGINNTPNCGSGCAYINVRVAPTNNGNQSGVEGTAGVVWQFGSAEAAQSYSIRLNSELQKYKTEQEIIDYLSRQLADALEKNQFDRARIIAITLAPKLGYSSYKDLLNTVTNGRVKE
jgi:hypothetical protein